MNISSDGVIFYSGSESLLVEKVKKKQDCDPTLLHLKGVVHQQKVEVVSQRGDSVLHYQGHLCIPKVDELKN